MRPALLLALLLPLTPADGLAADATPAPPAAPAAPAATPLTLDEAIRLALSRNFVVRSAALTPRIATARLVEAAGQFDPVLQSRYTYSDDGSIAPTDPFGGNRPPASIVQTDQYQVSLGGMTTLGTRYAFVGQTVNQRGTYNQFADTYYSFAGVQVTQPLLRGFGFGPNLIGIRVARASRAIAEADYRQAVIDTITRTITVYQQLYLAQQGYEISRRSHELALGLLQENRRRVEVGGIAPADVTIAEARVARLEDGVIESERNLRDAQNLFLTLISDTVRPALDQPLAITPPAVEPVALLDRGRDLNRAYTLRPDFLQAQENLKRSDAVLAANRSELLPQVDLVATYGYNGSGNTFDESYRDVRTRDTKTWSAGAVVSIPVPFREGRGKFRAAKLTKRQAALELQRLEQAIAVAVTNAAGQIESTAKRVEATRRARQLALASLVAEQKRLQVGQSTTFTVLQFQELLAAAEVAEYRALADHNIAVAEYDRQTGTTLEKRNVQLDGPGR